MPNGGSDCCGTCWFNQSLEGQRGSGNFNREIPSHCEIRDLDIIICVSGGGDGEPTAELAMPVVEHVLGDSVHAGVDNPPRTGYGRLQMTTSQTARSDPAAPFGAR